MSGSVSAFVEEMNAEAQALGCENTHFVNPTGLHDPQHYTSAWDLSLIATEALKYPDFLTICDSIKEIIPATNLSSERVLRTTNYLLDTWRALGYRYRNAHGIKTGSTSDAGYCLVSSAEKGELRFLSVVMGCERVVDASGKADVKSFSETKRLFEWGFENFSYKTVQSVNDMLASIPVTLSQETNSVVLHLRRTWWCCCPTPSPRTISSGSSALNGSLWRRRSRPARSWRRRCSAMGTRSTPPSLSWR